MEKNNGNFSSLEIWCTKLAHGQT